MRDEVISCWGVDHSLDVDKAWVDTATRHSPLARSVAVDPYIRTHAHVRPPSGINIGLGSGVLGSDTVIDRTTADCSLPLHSLSVIHLRQSRRTLQSRDNKDEN